MNTLTAVALILSAIIIAKKYLDFKTTVSKLHNWPGLFNTFSSESLIGFLLPSIKGFHRNRNHLFVYKHEDFKVAGWNVISECTLFPSEIGFLVADAVALKEILNSRVKFPKPIEFYDILSFFGKNVVATEGDEWKRHRRISAPAFSEKNNRLAWDATVSVVEELMEDIWLDKAEVTIDHFLDITIRLALMVLSIAGYGRSMTWKEDTTIPPGHKMNFTDALITVSESLLTKLVVPKWAMRFTKRTKRIQLAFEEIEIYMSEMIAERRLLLDKEDRWDLLTNLIRGSDDEQTGESKLTYTELTGNIFIYLLAGHETTANTLCYAVGLLALYPDEQEKLYKHIQEVVGDRKPTYDDYFALTRVLACIYETLRLYPIVTSVPKRAAEDVVITTTSADPSKDKTAQIVVEKGTVISLHIPGIHYNPRYWKDPNVYNPDRFLGDWNRDAFMVFSSGARACIGRRFSETESVAALTTLLTRYKVSIKDEPQFRHETPEQRRVRIFTSNVVLTLTPLRAPLVFTRR